MLRKVQILIEHNADVNSQNYKNQTVMHLLAMRPWSDMKTILESLITAGADVNALDKKGNTPLYYAKNAKNKAILIENGAITDVQIKKDRLHHLLLHCKNKTTLIKKYIEEGDNINGKDDIGNTPIYYARNVNSLKILIEHGALINVQNMKGSTPLHHFIFLWKCMKRKIMEDRHNDKFEKIIKFLIENEGDVNISNSDGKSPLQIVDEDLINELEDIVNAVVRNVVSN